MRTAVAALIGLVGGFVVGLMIDQILGVIGLLASDEPIGSKFVPVICAILGLVVAVLVDRQMQRRKSQPGSR